MSLSNPSSQIFLMFRLFFLLLAAPLSRFLTQRLAGWLSPARACASGSRGRGSSCGRWGGRDLRGQCFAGDAVMLKVVVAVTVTATVTVTVTVMEEERRCTSAGAGWRKEEVSVSVTSASTSGERGARTHNVRRATPSGSIERERWKILCRPANSK